MLTVELDYRPREAAHKAASRHLRFMGLPLMDAAELGAIRVWSVMTVPSED